MLKQLSLKMEKKILQTIIGFACLALMVLQVLLLLLQRGAGYYRKNFTKKLKR
ncbi:MAG: hypothetical protein H0U70_00380 [Tatlockia sp.]|nr:hypothetical protein [Tatlockia sp.]